MAIFFQKQRLEDAAYGSPELALELLTIGGARALRLEHEIGSLEPGKRADVICIDAERVSLVPRVNLLSNLVYSNDSSAVRSVFVDGVECVQDGVHTRLDEGRVIEAAQRAAERLLKAAGRSPRIWRTTNQNPSDRRSYA